jgi:hypothetical protein
MKLLGIIRVGFNITDQLLIRFSASVRFWRKEIGSETVHQLFIGRMDLGEVGWGDVDWIGLAKDRNRWRALVNSVLNLRVP